MRRSALRGREQLVRHNLGLVARTWSRHRCSLPAHDDTTADALQEAAGFSEFERYSKRVIRFLAEKAAVVVKALRLSQEHLANTGVDQLASLRQAAEQEQAESDPQQSALPELMACLDEQEQRIIRNCYLRRPPLSAFQLRKAMGSETPTNGMTPNEIRTSLLSQNQRVARITQGWTVVSCSPDNELTAKAGAAPGPWSRCALLQALHGMQSVDGAFRRRLKRSHRSDERPALSSKELELIHLLARGHNGPQIASLRQRRCDSIRHQLSVIYRKTGVRNQRGLIAWALAHGVIRQLDLDFACGSTPTGSQPS